MQKLSDHSMPAKNNTIFRFVSLEQIMQMLSLVKKTSLKELLIPMQINAEKINLY